MGNSGTVQPEDGATEKRRTAASPAAPLSWRRDLFGVLYGSGAFLVFLILADVLPVLVYVGCLVFLPIGVWVGRGSRRPWLDGLVYSGLATLVVALLLFIVSDMGWIGVLAALFLALPQGILGVRLGARLLQGPQGPGKGS